MISVLIGIVINRNELGCLIHICLTSFDESSEAILNFLFKIMKTLIFLALVGCCYPGAVSCAKVS